MADKLNLSIKISAQVEGLEQIKTLAQSIANLSKTALGSVDLSKGFLQGIPQLKAQVQSVVAELSKISQTSFVVDLSKGFIQGIPQVKSQIQTLVSDIGKISESSFKPLDLGKGFLEGVPQVKATITGLVSDINLLSSTGIKPLDLGKSFIQGAPQVKNELQSVASTITAVGDAPLKPVDFTRNFLIGVPQVKATINGVVSDIKAVGDTVVDAVHFENIIQGVPQVMRILGDLKASILGVTSVGVKDPLDLSKAVVGGSAAEKQIASLTDQLRLMEKAISPTDQAIESIIKRMIQLGATSSQVTQSLKTAGISFDQLGSSNQKVIQNLAATEKGVNNLGGAFGKLVSGLKFLAGGFLALEAVSIIKSFADVAARTETLGVVLDVVGTNAGYTKTQLHDVEEEVKKLGITASSAREAITKLIQADIPVEYAKPLARAAQDLAVISGFNSSETFQRLITNIQQLDVQGLRFMGIVIDREKAFADAKRATGKEVTSANEKQVFANAVLAKAAEIQGVYEASLNSVGKQLTSIPRYVENFQKTLGDLLLPTYLELVKTGIALLDLVGELAKAFSGASQSTGLFGTQLDGTGGILGNISGSIKDLTKFVKENGEAIKEWGLILEAVFLGFAVTKGVSLLITGFQALRLLIVPVTAAFASLSAGVAGIGAAFTAAGGGLAGVGAALLAFLGPVGVVIAAVAALVAVGYGLYTLYQKLKGGQEELSVATSTTAQNVEKYLKIIQDETNLRKELGAAIARQLLARNQLAAADTGEKIVEAKEELRLADEQKTAVDKRLEGLQKEKLALEKLIDTAKDLTKADRTRIEQSLIDQAKVIAAIKATAKEHEALLDALKKAGIDYEQFTTGVSLKFNEAIQGIVAGLKLVPEAADNTSAGITALIDKMIELATQTKTEEELKLYLERLKEVGAAAKAAGVEVGGLLTGAKTTAESTFKKAADERKAGGAAALQEAKAFALARQAAISSGVQSEAALNKALNDEKTVNNERANAQGLLSLEEYYAARTAIVKSNQVDELRVVDAQIAELAVKARQAETASARLTAKTSLEAEKKKREQIVVTQDTKLLEEQNAKLKAQEDLRLRIRSIQLDNAVRANDLDAAAKIEQINQKYNEQIKAIGLTKEGVDALNVARERDIKDVVLQTEQLKITRDRTRETNYLAEAQATVSLAETEGLITSREAGVQRDALQRDRIAGLETEYARLQAIAAIQGQTAEQEATNQDRLSKARQELLQVRKELGTDKGFQGLRDGLEQVFNGLTDRTKSFGQVIKDVIGNAFKNIGQEFNKQLADDLAVTIKKFFLKNATAGAPGQGAPGGDGSLFGGVVTSVKNLFGSTQKVTAPDPFPDPTGLASLGGRIGSLGGPPPSAETLTVFEQIKGQAATGFESLGNDFDNFFSNVGESFAETSQSIFETFDGLSGDLSGVFETIKGGASGLLDTVTSFFQSSGGDGTTGEGLYGLIGSFFGPGQADGGPVMAGKIYPVNERRPELLAVNGKDFLMMGDQSGTVKQTQPGSRTQVTQSQNFTINVPANTSRETANQTAASIQERLSRGQFRNS